MLNLGNWQSLEVGCSCTFLNVTFCRYRLIFRKIDQMMMLSEKRARKLAKDEWKNQLPIEPMDIDKLCLSIDTTLTPEQRTYVDMLKKKMKGAKGVKCKIVHTPSSPTSRS